MSKLYNIIKKYYTNGIYTKEDVKLFLTNGKITEDEYKEILKFTESKTE